MIKIVRKLGEKIGLGVILNGEGELTIHIAKEMCDPIKIGHQVMGDKHTTWIVIRSEIVELIKKAVEHKDKWIVEEE